MRTALPKKKSGTPTIAIIIAGQVHWIMDIYEMLDYDAWATAKLLEAVAVLTPEQFIREFGGTFSSVRQQVAHLLSVSDRYRTRLMQEPVPNISPEDFATPHELMIYAALVRRGLTDLRNNLKEEELGRVIEHATRRGPFRASVEQTLRHMVNHGTYHRGQIVCLLKLHDVEFEDTDYIIWLNLTRE